MDTTIVLSRRLRKDANPIEGAFFLAAAHGFKARLHSDRNQYRIAANEGRKALKFLKESKEFTAYSPELLFGDGLINYYSTWIRENYPWLKPIMMFFPKGDKDEGIKQLREVSRNAFYSRTEAQYYLMNILFHDEKEYGEARIMAEYLHSTYPNNSYFHRWYGRMLYQTGHRKLSEQVNLEVMHRIDSGYVGYEENTGRYAAYFLARFYRGQRQFDKAVEYFLKAEQFAIDAKATDKGYYHQTLYYLGEINYKRKDLKKAEYYYRKVKKLASRKTNAYKKAKEALKKM